MRPTRTGARAARPTGAYAAVVAALLLAVLALVAHHGSVPWQALQTAPSASASAGGKTQSPHTHPAFADTERAAPGHAVPAHTGTGGVDLAHPEAAPSGHDHGGQNDCGPASGTCQSAKVTVDVALPPRARLILPGPAPRPLPLPHAARAALPTPPELAELSILRI